MNGPIFASVSLGILELWDDRGRPAPRSPTDGGVARIWVCDRARAVDVAFALRVRDAVVKAQVDLVDRGAGGHNRRECRLRVVHRRPRTTQAGCRCRPLITGGGVLVARGIPG